MSAMEHIIKTELNTTKLDKVGHSGGGCISKGHAYNTDHGVVFIKKNQRSKVEFCYLCVKVR